MPFPHRCQFLKSPYCMRGMFDLERKKTHAIIPWTHTNFITHSKITPTFIKIQCGHQYFMGIDNIRVCLECTRLYLDHAPIALSLLNILNSISWKMADYCVTALVIDNIIMTLFYFTDKSLWSFKCVWYYYTYSYSLFIVS